MLKPFKNLKSAIQAAENRPFIRIGDVYLVATDSDRHDVRYTRVEIIGPQGEHGGSATVAMIDAFSKGYKLPRIDDA